MPGRLTDAGPLLKAGIAVSGRVQKTRAVEMTEAIRRRKTCLNTVEEGLLSQSA